jgi:hypothetical protein
MIWQTLSTYVCPMAAFFGEKVGGKDDLSENLNTAAPSHCKVDQDVLIISSVSTICPELATVPRHHFESVSGYKSNHFQIGGQGCQHTRSVNLGIIRCQTAHPSELGGLSAGRPVGPSIDSYKAVVFAVH